MWSLISGTTFSKQQPIISLAHKQQETYVPAGVVKATQVYHKNPVQHYYFNMPTPREPKLMECARVDGACDEGPSCLEVQFCWSLHHLEERLTFATIVTSRSSSGNQLQCHKAGDDALLLQLGKS